MSEWARNNRMLSGAGKKESMTHGEQRNEIFAELAGLCREHGAVILPGDGSRAGELRDRIKVTERSTLGALITNCGGIIADHGWFKILGHGGRGLPGVGDDDWTGVPGPAAAGLVIGYDAVGGTFAIDAGGLGVKPGEVCYYGPDTLSWGGLGGGHTAFVEMAITGNLGSAFEDLRWTGWEQEVSALSPEQGISLYPPPFSVEGKDPGTVSRRAIPLTELLAFYR